MFYARRTVHALQVLSLLFMFVPAVPLLQYIYTGQGNLTQTQIGTVQTVVWLTILLADMPTGRLADEYSYKHMLVATCLFYGASFGTLAFATSFWMFVVSSVLWGLGTSCFRGVPNSLARLAIDESHDQRAEKEFTSFVRFSLVYAAIGEALASGVAGVIVNNAGGRGLQLVSLTQVVVAAIMLWVVIWGVTNLRAHKHTTRPSLLTVVSSGWAETAKSVVAAFRASGQLRAMLLFGAVIGCTTMTMVWLSQTYLQRIGVEAQRMPWIWMMYHVMLALFVLLAMPLSKMRGSTTVLAALPFVAAAGYIALVFVPGAVGQWLILVFYLVRALQMPLVQVAVIRLSPAHLRATIFGVMSTVQFILFCVMNLAISVCVDAFSELGTYGTEAAFVFSALVYGPLGYAAIRYVRRYE